MTHTRLFAAAIARIAGFTLLVMLSPKQGFSDTVPQVEYSVLAGSKPEYFEDPGQYLQQGLNLYADTHRGSASLTFGVTSVASPVRRTSVDDSLLKYISPNLLGGKFSRLNTNTSYVIPLSLESREKNSRGVLSSSLGASILPNQILSPGMTLILAKYLYRYSNDAEGNPNRDLDVKIGFNTTLKLAKAFTATLGIAQIHRLYHASRPKDLYESSLGMSLALNERISLTAQVLTSESLIKKGQSNRVKLYEKDITQAELGLSFIYFKP